MPQEVIVARDLRHSYDGKRFALNGVDLSVHKGEVFGLLGKNGAGKTTLIKVMTTLIRATSGELQILGMDPVHRGKEIRSRIGVVQQGESFDFTSVEGNLDIYGVLWGVPKGLRQQRREELLHRFEIDDIRKERSFDLSGGQKRRVQVAREFMHDMDILFLDEPTVGLDVIMRRNLLDSIREQVRGGLTVLFTTHNLEEADYLCDRVAVIDSGRILVNDTLENLKRRYGGKRTIEVTVALSNAEAYFEALGHRLSDQASVRREGGSGLILTSDVRGALGHITELASAQGAQIEWLNVRKNTLEDVFLNTVAHPPENDGAA